MPRTTTLAVVGALITTTLAHPTRGNTSDANALARRQTIQRSNNYSGATLTSSPDGTPFNYITAQINIPETDYVTAESSPGTTTQTSASWVGFGGAISGTNGILQTGCSVYNDGQGDTYSRCWREYYPDPPLFFDDEGFNPAIGDTVLLELTRTSDTTGTAKLTNLNSGDVVTADLTAPDGHSATGEDADWILENPGMGRPNLVNFHTEFFEGCSAQTAAGNVYGPGDGTYKLFNEFKDLGDGQGRQKWTNSFLPSDSEVQVDFVAPYS